MKEIQLKKKEWQDKKEILQNSNEALQAEATQLEAEILSAVDDIQKIKKEKSNEISKKPHTNLDNSSIPKNTLRLIEEAEKFKN